MSPNRRPTEFATHRPGKSTIEIPVRSEATSTISALFGKGRLEREPQSEETSTWSLAEWDTSRSWSASRRPCSARPLFRIWTSPVCAMTAGGSRLGHVIDSDSSGGVALHYLPTSRPKVVRCGQYNPTARGSAGSAYGHCVLNKSVTSRVDDGRIT